MRPGRWRCAPRSSSSSPACASGWARAGGLGHGGGAGHQQRPPELVVCASPETARRPSRRGCGSSAGRGARARSRARRRRRGDARPGGAQRRRRGAAAREARDRVRAALRDRGGVAQAGRAPGRALAAAGRGRALRLGGHSRCACSSVLDDAERRGDRRRLALRQRRGASHPRLRDPARVPISRRSRPAVKAPTGVVDHGLFLDQADEVLLGAPDGSLERLVRP